MAEGVLMPKAGITVESCIIGQWQKKVGDKVALGEILFTYETDKAMFECESTAAGELLAIFFSEGDEVPCLVNVCAVGAPGEDYSSLIPEGATAASAAAASAAAASVASASVASASAPAAAPAASAPAAAAAEPITASAPATTTASAGDVHVSPRAKGLAERSGVDAALATPTGPNGRIIERDVRKLMEEGVQAAVAAAAPKAAEVPAAVAPIIAEAPQAEYEDVKFSGIRKAIARSMHESLSTMAQLTHHFSFDATQIMAYRAMIKQLEGDMSKITLNDMILFAVSRTLLNHPDLNANMVGDSAIRHFKHVQLGCAVDTPRGLMVPTLVNADTKSLLEISVESKKLANMAREGSINPDLLKGGSFTVSNLGSLNVEMFTPVINPPQTGILGVCNIQTRVREKGGVISTYQAMGLSLTYDHRAVDGAPASRFMTELCKNLESFTALLAK